MVKQWEMLPEIRVAEGDHLRTTNMFEDFGEERQKEGRPGEFLELFTAEQNNTFEFLQLLQRSHVYIFCFVGVERSL